MCKGSGWPQVAWSWNDRSPSGAKMTLRSPNLAQTQAWRSGLLKQPVCKGFCCLCLPSFLPCNPAVPVLGLRTLEPIPSFLRASSSSLNVEGLRERGWGRTDPCRVFPRVTSPSVHPGEGAAGDREERGREKPGSFFHLLLRVPLGVANLPQFVQASPGSSTETPTCQETWQFGETQEGGSPHPCFKWILLQGLGHFCSSSSCWEAPLSPSSQASGTCGPSLLWAPEQSALRGSLQLPATATVQVAASSFLVSQLCPQLGHQFLLSSVPTAACTSSSFCFPA